MHITVFAQTQWTLDKAHSKVKFTVEHMMINEMEGEFKSFDGTFISSKPDFTDAQVNFNVDVSSLSTNNEMRDNHLKSDDFFNAQQFSQMTFKSTSINKVSDKKYQLLGNLTIRDVTKPVTFDVTYGGSVKDQRGTHVGFKATTIINRFDYNLKWNKMIEAGGAVAGQDVTITINAEFLSQQ